MSAEVVPQSSNPRSSLRRRWLWVSIGVSAFLLYALAGFFLVPWIIHSQIRSQGRTLLHREAVVDDVRFNPFTLAATIRGLKLSDLDGANLVGLDLLRADVQVSGLFRRALRFREIRLEHPVAAARILMDGRPSIADLIESKTDPETPASSFQLPRLIVDRLIVTAGVVQFTDASRQPAHQSRFEPLNLDVRNLITIPEEGGEHTITIGVDDGAVLRWTGQQTVDPLRFAGRLDVTGLNLHTLWDYLGDGQTLDVSEGRADVVLPYEIKRGNDQRIQMTLDGASASIRSLSVRPRNETNDWLTVPELRVTNVKAAWPAARLDIASVHIVKPHMLARLEEDGALNWSRAITNAARDIPANDSATPWTFRIGSVDVEGGSVSFEDFSAEPDLKIEVADVAVRAQDISSDLTRAIAFKAKARMQESGAIEADGTIVPSPIAADVKFAAHQIGLAALRPYIPIVPGARIGSGMAALQGQVSVSGEKPSVKVAATGSVDDVELQNAQGDRVATWRKMGIEGLTLEDPPSSARVRKVTLERPFAKVLIDQDGNLNLTRLTVAPDAVRSASVAPDRRQPEQQKPPTLEIGTVEIRDASAEFSDQSLPLSFSAAIHSANGTIRDVSSFAAAPATVALEGRVDETGYVKVGGTLRLADPMASSEIAVGFRSIQMPGLSPYFAEFAGYKVQSGVLDLDVRYQVKDRRLIGNHTVTAGDLVLGDKVASSTAPGLAVRLAVALLKDRNGRINIDVPIEGTVDSPEFAYRKVFWSAVRTILGNAAKAPFRAIGRLFGRDEDDLELVEFDPGRSDLLPAEQDTLARLAEQIGPRRELTLTVEGRFDPVSDPAALKRMKLERLIESRRESATAAAAAAGGSTLETILEALFVEQFAAEALQSERQRFTPAPAAVTPPGVGAPQQTPGAVPAQAATSPAAAGFDAAGFYESLRARLLEAQNIAPADLRALAAARSATIMATLTKSGAVESIRAAAADPAPVSRRKSGSVRIASELTMSAEPVSSDGRSTQ